MQTLGKRWFAKPLIADMVIRFRFLENLDKTARQKCFELNGFRLRGPFT